MKGASFFPFLGVMLAAWGVYEVVNLVMSAGQNKQPVGDLRGTAFLPIAPGVTEAGSINSTGGFTAAPDANGIGGGFAT